MQFRGGGEDATGSAGTRLLALAKAFGTLRAGAFEVGAVTKAALALYVEQTVGPLLGAAVLAAFEAGTPHTVCRRGARPRAVPVR